MTERSVDLLLHDWFLGNKERSEITTWLPDLCKKYQIEAESFPLFIMSYARKFFPCISSGESLHSFEDAKMVKLVARQHAYDRILAPNRILSLERANPTLRDEINRAWDKGMTVAAKRGDRKLFDFFTARGANHWSGALYRAAEGGHCDLVELLLEKGADVERGLRGAALGGHSDLVQFLLEKGADPAQGLFGAADGGHLTLVTFLLEKCPDELPVAQYRAGFGGNLPVVKFLLEKDVKGADEVLRGAAVNNKKEIIDYMIDYGFNELNGALYEAAVNQHKELYWYLVGKGAERQSYLESDFELGTA